MPLTTNLFSAFLNDRSLEDISSARLCRLKEKTLPFTFRISYTPGKWNRGPDALSRGPNSTVETLVAACVPTQPAPSEDESIFDEHFSFLPSAAVASLNEAFHISPDVKVITEDHIRCATQKDATMQVLQNLITTGFPSTRHQTPADVREFWSVHDNLWVTNGIIMYKDRIVVPQSLRKHVLASLHAAHQGVTGMADRAAATVYWPGLNASIRNKRQSCATCNTISPSQPRQPLVLTPTASYPFEHICADFFVYAGHTFLLVVDRFTGWPLIYHYKCHQLCTSDSIISVFRSIFCTYGVSLSLSTDGGSQFVSSKFEEFLRNWGIHHRISSAYYPQSNGRAELGVKSAKRIIMNNVARDGSLNTDDATAAFLQYRNTPMQHVGLSPAQMLFHRQLRDGIPTDGNLLKPHEIWIKNAAKKERDFLSATSNSQQITIGIPKPYNH